MTQSTTNWNDLSKEASLERRQGRRLNLTFAIEISGIGIDGVPFAAPAKTEEVSENGCRIKSDLQLNRGDIVSIRLLGPHQRASEDDSQSFEIIWRAQNAEGQYLGARKLDSKKFWKVTFPPPK